MIMIVCIFLPFCAVSPDVRFLSRILAWHGMAWHGVCFKDIVTESESFDVERFIPLLQKYIRRANPYIRQLLVSRAEDLYSD